MTNDHIVDAWAATGGDTVEVYVIPRDCLRYDCDVRHREYRWRVKAANSEVVGSGEGHTRKQAAVEAALRHHPQVEQ